MWRDLHDSATELTLRRGNGDDDSATVDQIAPPSHIEAGAAGQDQHLINQIRACESWRSRSDLEIDDIAEAEKREQYLFETGRRVAARANELITQLGESSGGDAVAASACVPGILSRSRPRTSLRGRVGGLGLLPGSSLQAAVRTLGMLDGM